MSPPLKLTSFSVQTKCSHFFLGFLGTLPTNLAAGPCLPRGAGSRLRVLQRLRQLWFWNVLSTAHVFLPVPFGRGATTQSLLRGSVASCVAHDPGAPNTSSSGADGVRPQRPRSRGRRGEWAETPPLGTNAERTGAQGGGSGDQDQGGGPAWPVQRGPAFRPGTPCKSAGRGTAG